MMEFMVSSSSIRVDQLVVPARSTRKGRLPDTAPDAARQRLPKNSIRGVLNAVAAVPGVADVQSDLASVDGDAAELRLGGSVGGHLALRRDGRGVEALHPPVGWSGLSGISPQNEPFRNS